MPVKKPCEQVWLAEYEAYRSELLEMTKERYSILAISVTAIGVAFGFATGASSQWVVFLLPLVGYVVILPFAYLTFAISGHYHRITSYLEVFVEPNLGIQRERAWRIHSREFHHVAFSKPLMIIYALLIFVSSIFPFAYCLANIFIGTRKSFTNWEIAIAATETLIGLVISMFVWRKWGDTSKQPDARARWEKVKELISTEKGKNRR
jgi:NhaP-type Na+/H+ or K+/H+ antiporter